MSEQSKSRSDDHDDEEAQSTSMDQEDAQPTQQASIDIACASTNGSHRDELVLSKALIQEVTSLAAVAPPHRSSPLITPFALHDKLILSKVIQDGSLSLPQAAET